MADPFEALATALLQPDPAIDRCTLHLCAETSDFLRVNQGAPRQATGVQQAYVTVTVERGQRRTESTLSLIDDLAADVQRLRAERTLLTGQLDLIADDPWLQRPAPSDVPRSLDHRVALNEVLIYLHAEPWRFGRPDKTVWADFGYWAGQLVAEEILC